MYSMNTNCISRCVIFALFVDCHSFNRILLLKHDGKYYYLPSDGYSRSYSKARWNSSFCYFLSRLATSICFYFPS